jgi:hypothetical protein
VSCSTSSSSVPWWIAHARSGDPQPAAMSGNKCCSPDVSVLRLTHLGAWVKHRFTRIWEIPFIAVDNRNFRIKLSDAGNYFIFETWKAVVCQPSNDWSTPRVTVLNQSSGGELRLSLKGSQVGTTNVSSYSVTLSLVLMLFLSCKANSRV